ncbi:hypothetical protein KQX54_019214 [Cotesia glomerata]|uniref:Uncharacterized protein n=1 Tax=Cotesia glomerata TaxID=32391 RepID=A0AAV7IY29_COTGL|nr:hypothetical protein KQX54_019214 [Cotesia glomerata]
MGGKRAGFGRVPMEEAILKLQDKWEKLLAERIQKAKSGVLARHNWSTQTSKLVASWQIAPVKTKRVTVISISILISNPLMLLMLGSPIPNGHYGREILINVINHLEPFSDSS